MRPQSNYSKIDIAITVEVARHRAGGRIANPIIFSGQQKAEIIRCAKQKSYIRRNAIVDNCVQVAVSVNIREHDIPRRRTRGHLQRSRLKLAVADSSKEGNCVLITIHHDQVSMTIVVDITNSDVARRRAHRVGYRRAELQIPLVEKNVDRSAVPVGHNDVEGGVWSWQIIREHFIEISKAEGTGPFAGRLEDHGRAVRGELAVSGIRKNLQAAS